MHNCIKCHAVRVFTYCRSLPHKGRFFASHPVCCVLCFFQNFKLNFASSLCNWNWISCTFVMICQNQQTVRLLDSGETTLQILIRWEFSLHILCISEHPVYIRASCSSYFMEQYVPEHPVLLLKLLHQDYTADPYKVSIPSCVYQNILHLCKTFSDTRLHCKSL